MIFSVYFPTPLSEVNSLNDNIDVCVQLEDGSTYTLVVATPANLTSVMKTNNIHYIDPEMRVVIVDSIQEEVIYQVIERLIKNEKALRFYGED